MYILMCMKKFAEKLVNFKPEYQIPVNIAVSIVHPSWGLCDIQR